MPRIVYSLKEIIAKLKAANIPIGKIEEQDDLTDASIEITPKVHLQVNEDEGYMIICKEVFENGAVCFEMSDEIYDPNEMIKQLKTYL